MEPSQLTPTELARVAGISQPYASQVLNKRRGIKRALAIKVYRATGVKLGPIETMAEADIDTLERLENAG